MMKQQKQMESIVFHYSSDYYDLTYINVLLPNIWFYVKPLYL